MNKKCQIKFECLTSISLNKHQNMNKANFIEFALACALRVLPYYIYRSTLRLGILEYHGFDKIEVLDTLNFNDSFHEIFLQCFTDVESACKHIRSAPYRATVVKASGLAAGKGVVVAGNRDEACVAANTILKVCIPNLRKLLSKIMLFLNI